MISVTWEFLSFADDLRPVGEESFLARNDYRLLDANQAPRRPGAILPQCRDCGKKPAKTVDFGKLRSIVPLARKRAARARVFRCFLESPVGTDAAAPHNGKNPMFAVIKTGGKQYKVAKDDVIQIEKLDAKTGSKVAFDEVLMVGDDKSSTIGTPLVSGASVAGTVMEQARDDKVLVFKRKRRQGYRRMHGHRQHFTLVKITDISTGGKKAAAKKEEPAPEKTEGKADTGNADAAENKE
jgi:large subunit ribosomal protein L21